MRITVVCSDEGHPIQPRLREWVGARAPGAKLVTRLDQAVGGDFLFLVSCSELARKSVRDRYRHALVLHASDLPRGRGWSPHIWDVLAGAKSLTVTLLEAVDQVDSGDIWAQQEVAIESHLLWDEINDRLFDAELQLMTSAIEQGKPERPRVQGAEATYWPRRTPADSAVDPQASIASQFNLIRVCDPNRFPAYFDLHGHRYRIRLEKMDE